MNEQGNSSDQTLPSEAIAALTRGSKIDAIKSVRVARGVGLKEAKEIVEEFLARSPQVKSRMAAVNKESARSAISRLLLIAAIGLLIYYFLVGRT